MVCPNGKRFHFLRSAPIKGNRFGRTEEYCRCEYCTACLRREKCHKSKENRIVRTNEELTKFHNDVLDNLNCVHGALLRMNRSIQAEGTFGGIKWNSGYRRLRRRDIDDMILELGLISCGFNLYKYHLKKIAIQKMAQFYPQVIPGEIAKFPRAVVVVPILLPLKFSTIRNQPINERRRIPFLGSSVFR